MLSLPNLFVLQVALEKGKILPLDLKSLLGDPSLPLVKKLDQENIISELEWKALRQEARRRPSWPQRPQSIHRQNQKFFSLLNQSGTLSREDLSRLHQSYQSAVQTRQIQPLEELVINQGLLSRAALSSEFQVVSKAILSCKKCKWEILMDRFAPWHHYPCPQCRTELVFTGKTLSHDETRDSSAPPMQTGPLKKRSFGPYQILKKLGQGGMGAVYLAQDSQVNRQVALKVITSQGAENQQYIDRFYREVRLAGRLQHPYIVPVFDCGEVEGHHYYTMGFVPGQSLREYVEEKGPLSEKEALDLAGQVAQALEYAHEQGVLHRDIKPDNILIGPQGDPFIMDFGLARQVEAKETKLTKTGAIVGSPQYMAPEQASGDYKIDYGADIYALGGVLFFMFTGRPPFLGEDMMKLLMQVIEKEPPQVRDFCPQASREVEVIVAKCLEKSPHKRYPNMGLLAYDLKACGQGEPIQARPPSFLERVFRKVKKHRLASLSVVALILFVLGTLAAFSYSAHMTRQKERQRAQQRLEKKISRLGKRVKSSLKAYPTPSPEDFSSEFSPSGQSKGYKEEIRRLIALRGKLENLAQSKVHKKKIQKWLTEIETAIGHLALRGKNYILGEIFFENLVQRGKKKEARRWLTTLKEIRNRGKKGDLQAVKKIMKNLQTPPSEGMVDEYTSQIVRRAAPHVVRLLLPFVESPYEWQRKVTIESLGKIRDKSTRVQDMDAGQWLIKRLKELDVKTEAEEARMIIWALGRLRDSRANVLINKVRNERGQNTSFWKRTEIPYRWIPARNEKRDSGKYQYWNNLALDARRKGRYKQALKYYQKALALNPNHSSLYANRGHLFVQLKKNSQALEDFEQALNLNPQNTKAMEGMANVLFVLNRKQEALKLLNKAIQINSKNPSLYFNRGNLLASRKKYNLALRDFDRAVELEPGEAKFYIHRGAIYLFKNQPQKALAEFNRALQREPDSLQALKNRSKIYFEQKKYQLALDDLNKALRKNPRKIDLYRLRARTYRQLKNPSAALRDYNQILQIRPDAESYSNRAIIWVRKREYKKAIKDFKKAIETDPTYALAYKNLAAFYANRKKHDQAIPLFKKYLKLSPQAPEKGKIEGYIRHFSQK